jgi:hypothetical protein
VRRLLAGCLLGCLVGGAAGMPDRSALAHHSFSSFDLGAPTELDGTAQEFRYTNPHCFIVLKVKGTDGRIVTWTLEGMPPSFLERDGWSRNTLKPGDQIRLTILPLRSGGAGGMWNPQGLRFRDGKTVAAGR